MRLDQYRVIKTKCTGDASVLKEIIEHDRVYNFLVGMNSEFDQIKIQILEKQITCVNDMPVITQSEDGRNFPISLAKSKGDHEAQV